MQDRSRPGTRARARIGVVWATVLACAVAASALGAPAVSAASSPATIEAVACPSTGQCTATGGVAGPGGLSPYQITFGPSSGTVVSRGFQGTGLAGARLACPSATQCTEVVGQSEVTFDPTTGTVNPAGVKQLLSSGSGADAPALESLSCPSVTQCTAGVEGSGAEVTFDPTSGAVISTAVLLGNETGPVPVACPSTSQCSMVGEMHDGEVTFDPITGTPNAAGTATLAPPYESLLTLACSSATQCTAGSLNGYAYTFTPATGQITVVKQVFQPKPDQGQTGSMNGLQCPSMTQCTASGDGGDEVTFDPTTDTPNAAGPQSVSGLSWLNALSCPTVDQCTAVGEAQQGDPQNGATQQAVAVVFDPATGASGTVTVLDPPSPPTTPTTPTTPSAPSGPTGPTAPTSKQISQALSSALAPPTGSHAKITTLLRTGSYSYPVKVAVPGTLSTKWYYVPQGARLTMAKARPVLVAKGSVKLKARGRLKVVLGAAGRKLLKRHTGKHAKALALTAVATYKPNGGAARSSKRRFVLKP